VAVVILHVHKYGKGGEKKKVTRKFKSGGLHERHVVATWNLGTISAFVCRHKETKKNLCRAGRSQDLPDTDF